MEKCSVCLESTTDGKPIVVLKQKGSGGVNLASVKRGSDLKGDTVHINYRRIHCRENTIKHSLAYNQQLDEQCSELRSAHRLFNFQEYCGQSAKSGLKRSRNSDVYQVRTHDFQDSVLLACRNRNDKWSNSVSGRLASMNDLHAADTIYHQQCSSNFRTGKNVPSIHFTDTVGSAKKPKL